MKTINEILEAIEKLPEGKILFYGDSVHDLEYTAGLGTTPLRCLADHVRELEADLQDAKDMVCVDRCKNV